MSEENIDDMYIKIYDFIYNESYTCFIKAMDDEQIVNDTKNKLSSFKTTLDRLDELIPKNKEKTKVLRNEINDCLHIINKKDNDRCTIM